MPLLYHNNNSISNITSFPQVPSGSPVLLSTATASSSASIEFTSGIDSTYQVYYFLFYLHPNTDDTSVGLNFSTDGGSNYNVTKTTTFFRATHREDDTNATLEYRTNADLAQSTGNQPIGEAQEGESDSNLSGSLHLFNPSSTTYVKHFIMNVSGTGNINLMENAYIAGYGNTTSAINGVKFFGNGTTITGTIKMYGLK